MKKNTYKAACLLSVTMLALGGAGTNLTVKNLATKYGNVGIALAAEKKAQEASANVEYELEYELTEQAFGKLSWGVTSGAETFFCFRDETTGLFGVVDSAGTVVLEPEYENLSAGDQVLFGHKLVKEGQKTTYKNTIFDGDLSVFGDVVTADEIICSVDDGMASFASVKNPGKMIYLDLEKTGAEIIDPGKVVKNYRSASAFSNGYAVVCGAKKKGGKSETYLIDRTGQAIAFVYEPLLNDKEQALPLISAPVSDDWWAMYDESGLSAVSLAMPDGTKRSPYGFYNLYARQNVLFPEGYGVMYEWKPVRRRGADVWTVGDSQGAGGQTEASQTGVGSFVNTQYVKDGYAVWASREQRLFDICRGEFATETSYSYLELADVRNEEKHMLCQTTGGQWGYLNDIFALEKIYDKAASFGGGYAVVIEGGKCSIINAKLETVCPDICQADDVYLLGTDDEKVYFSIVNTNGQCQILSVASEHLKKANPYRRTGAWKEQVGSYLLEEMSVDGKKLAISGNVGKKADGNKSGAGASILNLKKNGNGELVNKTQILPIHWDGKKLYVEGENIEYQYENEKITMDYDSSSGKVHAVYAAEK